MDSRFVELAKTLVNYSTKVKKGDRVLLMSHVTTPHEMHLAIIDEVHKAGGVMMEPILADDRLLAACLSGCSKEQLGPDAAARLMRYLAADVRIAFRGFNNILELSNVPPDKMQLFNQVFTDLTLKEGLERTRWVLTRWPTSAYAQLTGMSTAAFEDAFFKAVLTDYEAMTKAAQPLVKLMTKTKLVKIIGPGDTELTFSIEGIPTVPCTGLRNIPDGEVYTAPVRDSMNGIIHYNTVTVTHSGQRFSGVRFEVENGKIIKATCDDGDEAAMNKMLDTDEGARFFGEFALGINWNIDKIVGETLFDEKVGGTLHLTPGNAYDDAPNGNQSGIHWDIVLDQREQSGGGEIWFDDKLVRKDGLFLPKGLQALNPAD